MTEHERRALAGMVDRELLFLAVEMIINIDRKVDNIMSNMDQLNSDVQALVGAFGTLSDDLTTGLTNLHAQIAGLEGSAGDAQALQTIDHNITGLIERAQQADALVKAADPGTQPAADGTAAPVEDAPVDAPLPDETAVPVAPETPETPVTAPSDEPFDAGSQAETPAGPVDPADPSEV